MTERDRLVDRPALEASDADGREHEVRPLERVIEVGRGPERDPVAMRGRLAFEHERDPVEARGIDVM